MVEAYRVGITLLLDSNVPREVGVLSRAFTELDRIIKRTQISVNELAAGMRGLNRVGQSAAAAWSQAAAAMERAANAARRAGSAMPMPGAGGYAGGAAGAGGASPPSSGGALVPLAGGALAGAAAGGIFARFGGGGAIPPGGTPPLALPGPGGIPLNPRFSPGWKVPRVGEYDYLHAGIAAGMAGGGIMAGLRSALEQGADVAHLQAILGTDKRLHPDALKAALNVAYFATQKAPGSTLAGNMGALIDLKTVTGDIGEAMLMLPAFAELSTVLNTVQKTRTGRDEPVYAAAKALEILGKLTDEVTDPKTGKKRVEFHPQNLNKLLSNIARVDVATGGRVDPAEILAFAKMGAVPGMMMSDEFLWEIAPAMIQVMGGSRFGTAMMSMFQVVEGERMTAKTYDALAKIGLAKQDPHTKVVVDPKTGRSKRTREQVTTEGVYDKEMMFSNTLEWVRKAQERMEKAGVHGIEAQIRALSGPAAQRSTYARLLADFLKDMPAIEKEAANTRNVRPDLPKYLQANDPKLKFAAFQASLEKFLAMLGGPLMDPAIKMLDSLTDKLNKIADWEKEHPRLTELAGTGGGYLGAGLLGLMGLSIGSFFLRPGARVLGKMASLAAPGLFAGGAATTGAAGAAAAIPQLALVGGTAWGIGSALDWGREKLEEAIWGKTYVELRKKLEAERAERAKREIGNIGSWIFGNGSVGGIGRLLFGEATPAHAATQGPVPVTVVRSGGVGETQEAIPVKVAPDSADALSRQVAEAVKHGLEGVGVYLDGREVGRIVARAIADNMNRAPSGPASPDIRINPWGGQ